jgi:hypothetical protein
MIEDAAHRQWVSDRRKRAHLPFASRASQSIDPTSVNSRYRRRLLLIPVLGTAAPRARRAGHALGQAGIGWAKNGSPGAVPAGLDTGESSTVSYPPSWRMTSKSSGVRASRTPSRMGLPRLCSQGGEGALGLMLVAVVL